MGACGSSLPEDPEGLHGGGDYDDTNGSPFQGVRPAKQTRQQQQQQQRAPHHKDAVADDVVTALSPRDRRDSDARNQRARAASTLELEPAAATATTTAASADSAQQTKSTVQHGATGSALLVDHQGVIMSIAAGGGNG